MKKLFSHLIVALFFISCEKEIEVVLNSSSPRFVIEANVSAELYESSVKITKSLNFNQPTPYPTINNAIVSIKDDTANEEYIFINSDDGIYTNDLIKGVEEHSYTLSVKIDNEVFTATSTIPKSVIIDSLRQDGVAEESGFGNSKKSTAKIIPVYTDLIEKGNHYQFIVTKNNMKQGDLYLSSDIIFNGLVNTSDLPIEAKKGDVISVDMHCIDLPVFDYLFTLSQLYPSQGGPPSASPTNPASNINNNALGYFKAHTSNKKSIVVK